MEFGKLAIRERRSFLQHATSTRLGFEALYQHLNLTLELGDGGFKASAIRQGVLQAARYVAIAELTFETVAIFSGARVCCMRRLHAKARQLIR